MGGEYNIAIGIPYEAVAELDVDSHVSAHIHPYGNLQIVFNKREGLFTDVRARQAVNYTLDKNAILQKTFGDEQFYSLTLSLFSPEDFLFYSEAGKEIYETNDTDLAEQLLAEAGYNDEEIVILTSHDFTFLYNGALSVQEMLKHVGINAKVDEFDWATLLDRRNDPDAWDILLTGWDTAITPRQYTFLHSKTEWPGWTNNPEIDQILADMNTANTGDKLRELNEELHEQLWNYLPVINLGSYSKVTGINEKVIGYRDYLGPVLWNISKEE